MRDVKTTILLVGHCGPDEHLLKAAISRIVDGARFLSVGSVAELERSFPEGALALVNRELDGDFADTDGVRLIEQWAGRGGAMILVSNYPEAQERAQAAGAAPGFGKSGLYKAKTRDLVRAAIEGAH